MPASRIAVDVMGGDAAPEAIVRGALRACSPLGGLRIAPERLVLVGDRDAVEAILAEAGGNPGFTLLHTTQVIGMGDPPAAALRAKPDSSIVRCAELVEKGDAGALVSMGNTGAVVGASTIRLGTLPQVRRPGIAVTFELTGNPLTILDMGANIAPRPQDLVHYAVMGSVYTKDCLGKKEPRVGLLNIGTEAGKGTELLKEANARLESLPLYVGNLEPETLFQNAAEVVVTDGFTGNVVLKLLEGFSGFMLQLVLRELEAHEVRWAADALANVRKTIDYAEYGGALLLGVDGVVVIGHGRSDESAVSNAIGLACRALDANVNQHIVDGVARTAQEDSAARA